MLTPFVLACITWFVLLFLMVCWLPGQLLGTHGQFRTNPKRRAGVPASLIAWKQQSFWVTETPQNPAYLAQLNPSWGSAQDPAGPKLNLQPSSCAPLLLW